MGNRACSSGTAPLTTNDRDRRRDPDLPPLHRRGVGRSTSGATFESRNPADTRDVVGRFQQGTAADVAMAIKAAETAFPMWRRTPAPKRGEILYAFGALLAEHKERLARAMTREMGKVLAEARGDVQEGIDIAYLMAGEGRRMAGETVPSELPDKWAMSIRQPLGVAGIITPWNFPMAIPCWKTMPALVTGNTVVFKPSSDTPHCATLLVELMAEAGFPAGVVNLVTGSGAEVGDAIVDSPDVVGHLVHRLVGDGQAHRGPRRPPAQARLARARWQERRRGPRRRGPRPRHGRDPLVGLRHDRPALHGGLAGHRRAERRRAAPPAARGAGARRSGSAPGSTRPSTSVRSSTRAPSTRSIPTSGSGAARASSCSAAGARAAAASPTATSSSRRSSPASGRWTASARRRSSGRSCRSSRSTTTARRCSRSTRRATACRRASSPAT